MIKTKYIVFAMLSAVTMTGCATSALPSYNRNNYIYTTHSPNYYLRAQAVPILELPPGLSDSNIDDYYAIPPAAPTGATPVSLIPPGSLAEAHAMGTTKAKS